MAKSGGKSAGGSLSADASSLSFEQAVERLELIITQIESGEIGLERAVAEYERGAALIARCRSILDQAEQKVAELSVPGAGAKAIAPPEPDDDVAPF